MKRTSLIIRTGLALTAIAVPAVLSGCGGGASPSASQTVTSISVMDWFTTTGDINVDLLNKCAAKVGVTLNRQATPSSAYLPKVLQQASSKTLPDLLMLNDPDIAQIASIGALAPLTDFNINTDGFSQAEVQAGMYNGKLYGLLPTDDPYVLFYNKDLFTKAGVQPPTTWDELKAVAAKLTSGSQYGLAFTARASAGPTSSSFLPFAWGNGGDETNIDSPQFAEALQLWTDLVKSGSASSSVLNWSSQDAANQFSAGKAAMVISSVGVTPTIDKAGIRYGIVKIPGKTTSQKPVPGVADAGWTIPQTGNKAKQAKATEMVSCLTDDESQLTIANSRDHLPTRTSVADKFNAAHPQLAVVADLVKSARSRSAKLGPNWPKVETEIYNAIQAALSGKSTPSDALKQAKNNG